MEQYAITGGVPKYLEFFEDGVDLFQQVDAPVYFALSEKVKASMEVQKAFQGYQTIYGVFSKSGFTQRLLDLAQGNPQLLLINEDQVIGL